MGLTGVFYLYQILSVISWLFKRAFNFKTDIFSNPMSHSLDISWVLWYFKHPFWID